MNLPRQQQALYDLLFGRGDVPISDLYAEITTPLGDETTAVMQKWLGPYIARLNRRLKNQGLRVSPGALKNTYRLARI